MPHASYSTTFTYNGKEYPLHIQVYYSHNWPGESKHSFHVYIDRLLVGAFIRDAAGYWKNQSQVPEHKKSKKAKKLPFVLQAHDLQVIGEIIERELGEWV